MFLFKKAKDLQAFIEPFLSKNQSVGFVPTMGALHEGHLSLLRESLSNTQCTVCSIFVNPTQFNESTDLAHYPRQPAQDIQLLHQAGCHALFLPSVEEVYPADVEVPVPEIELGHLSQVLEGPFRPGHFEGVIQVVNRLLQLVRPTALYMGEKDYQQLLIVKKMVETLALPVEVAGCPTLREPDGLAMSSRNARLDPAQRGQALAIRQALLCAPDWLSQGTPNDVQAKGMDALNQAGLQAEYFELADADSLLPMSQAPQAENLIACAAAWCGNVRLIDNHRFMR